jgi:hypothetical protein
MISTFAILGISLLLVPGAGAYNRYNQGGSGCIQCHGEFDAGDPSLHSVHQAVVTCNNCHTDFGDDPQTHSSSNFPDPDGYSCNGCHYLEGIVTYHTSQIGAGCACHGGIDPPNPENVAPFYYEGDRSSLTDPCADNLDNDGDGMSDIMDPDCAVANWEHSWTTVKSVFGAD